MPENAAAKKKKKKQKTVIGGGAGKKGSTGGGVGSKKKNKSKQAQVEKKGKETSEEEINQKLQQADESLERDGGSEGDYSDADDEGADGYKPGGYHRVEIGDRFNNRRYTVLQKLGWGHFSTVWMVHDNSPRKESQRYVALKIQKSAVHYREAAYDEIELLNCVSTTASNVFRQHQNQVVTDFDPCVVELLDHFEHNGPHGRHVCMVFEVLGENLLSVIKKYDYRGIPIEIVRNMARQMLVGLDFLHRHCKIIHTDLKPENVLISTAVVPPPISEVNSILNKDRSSKPAPEIVDTKNLSSEQKKKLKKKNKKKRQNAKKMTGSLYPSEATLSLSEQLKEMKMMESESEPIGYNNGSSNKSSLAESKGNDNGSIEDMYISEEKYIKRESGLMDRGEKSSSSSQEKLSTIDDCKDELWMKRNYLFFNLNFNKEPLGEPAFNRVRSDSCSFRSLDFDDWESPGEDSYSKLTMITSVRKIYDFLGAPVSDIVASFADDTEDPLSSEEYCHVLSNSDWLVQLIADDNSLYEESCFFTVRGHGLEEDGICSLASTCIFDALSSDHDKITLRLPRNVVDAPVIWTITHDANTTKEVVRFLEEHLNGVRFVCGLEGVQINALGLEEDDSEMGRINSSLCIHPLSLALSDTDETEDSHQGSLLGLDLGMMGKSLVHDHDTQWQGLIPPSDYIQMYLRPLEDRYSVFTGQSKLIQEILDDLRNNNSRRGESKSGTGTSSGRGYVSNDYKNTNDGMNVRVQIEKHSTPIKDAVDYSDENLKCKIVDLGNACYTHRHFTDDIQTRQYRSPEVILGAEYDTSADIWSLACIIFELLCGDLMFDPKAGKTWDRDEDHLAMMIELIGPFPKNVYTKGKESSRYFQKSGDLRHIDKLKFWSLRNVLHEKYKISALDADEISSFLLPMLEIDQKKRATAQELLQHPWLYSTSSSRERPVSSALGYLSDQESDDMLDVNGDEFYVDDESVESDYRDD